MTRLFSDVAEAKLVGTHAIVAVAVIAVLAICMTGVAAFAGLLPESDRVANAVTATPIIDLQIDARRDDPTPRIESQLNSGGFGISVD